VVLQSPGVGIANVIDPAVNAGVEFREGDVPVAPGVEALGEPLGGVDGLTALETAVRGVDDKAEPGDAGGGYLVASWSSRLESVH
jgi:hypothetical protein